jgi:hypothetical protein
MKIAILTMPLYANYGGILQNYALQQVLKNSEHEVITIRYKYEEKYNEENLNRFYKFINLLKHIGANTLRFILGKKLYVWSWIVNKDINNKRSRCLDFINKYIYSSTVYESVDEIKQDFYRNKYDAVIVGSDQVWRPYYNIDTLYMMFLDFIADDNKIKKIAYGASFGVSTCEYGRDQIGKCSMLLKKFDAVSVREENGIKLCNDIFNYDKAINVVDPTMLLERSDYENLVINAGEEKNNGDLFCYILDHDDDKQNLIWRLCDKNGLKDYYVTPRYGKYRGKLEKRYECSVTEFLRAFMDAKYVITDSFHGCVFSIIFNKPFVCLGNINRGEDRFNSLLSAFNLENRLLKNLNICEFEMKLNEPIDWSSVNEIRRSLKNKSLIYLDKALNDKN